MNRNFKREHKLKVKAQALYLNYHYRQFPDHHVALFPKEKYELCTEFKFHWTDGRTITLPKFMRSDGATCAKDLVPLAFFVHDRLCVYPYFDDGSPVSNAKASWIYRSILDWNGKRIRARVRLIATFLFGGWTVKKKNGWFIPWKNK